MGVVGGAARRLSSEADTYGSKQRRSDISQFSRDNNASISPESLVAMLLRS